MTNPSEIEQKIGPKSAQCDKQLS